RHPWSASLSSQGWIASALVSGASVTGTTRSGRRRSRCACPRRRWATRRTLFVFLDGCRLQRPQSGGGVENQGCVDRRRPCFVQCAPHLAEGPEAERRMRGMAIRNRDVLLEVGSIEVNTAQGTRVAAHAALPCALPRPIA